VLAEFEDALNRYLGAKAERDYAGTAPITRASGTCEVVVARLVRNRRLERIARRPAPGARRLHDAHDPGPKTGKTARRKSANELVCILHNTLIHRMPYDEAIAWQHCQQAASAA
jgi:hypothetical protein